MVHFPVTFLPTNSLPAFNKSDLKKFLKVATTLALKAGDIQKRACGKKFKIDFKGSGTNDLVTEIDKKCETMIVKELIKMFPDHGILGEEGAERNSKKGFEWIIDPIDGTTNFAHGHPYFAVSIGLAYRGTPIVGAIYAPLLNELYTAAEGHGAFLNGKRIKVSATKKLQFSLLSTGFTYKKRGINLQNFEHFLYKTQSIRRGGAASIDLCYVAAGRIDGYWELGLKPWDITAGAVILKEAGGRITGIAGQKLDLNARNLLATNGKIHKEMLQFFTQAPELAHELEEAKKL